MKKVIQTNLIGREFGEWKALSIDGFSRDGHKMYLCQCKNGHRKVILNTNLTRGLSITCVECRKEYREKISKNKFIV